VAASSLQALSQHTPSVQCPLTHWPEAVQAAPIDFKPHDPRRQVLGETQSVSELQADLQAAPPQVKVPHEMLAGVTQVPAPSQAEAGV
jgi:hypothetical protein